MKKRLIGHLQVTLGMLSVLAVGSSCSSSISAAASRTVAPAAPGDLRLPVCFAPPDTMHGLGDQAKARHALDICRDAAQREGVTVVPRDAPACLVATTTWISRDTGDVDMRCSGVFFGGNLACSSSRVRAKSIRLVLSNRASVAVMESDATIRSVVEEFNDRSFFALCSAAFHDYPRPLEGALFQVNTN